MSHVTDPRLAARRSLPWPMAPTLGAALLGLTMALSSAPALAQDTPASPPISRSDDDPEPNESVLAEALEQLANGHATDAAELLRGLARRGNVSAMERLGLLHWFGARLYPGAAWDREAAIGWFRRAADQGSTLGRFMFEHAQRHPRVAALAPQGC